MKISWSTKQIYMIIGILLVVGFLYYLNFLWSQHIQYGLFEVVLVLLIGLVLLILFIKYFWRLDNFVSGIKGELKVGDVLLHDLPKSYIHLRDVNLEGRGNIDYILIGPTGIWTVEVKSHAGYIDFNGTELQRGGKSFEKDFLKQAWAQAFSVKNLLRQKLKIDYSIKPVIAFSNSGAKMKFGFNKVKGVYVISLFWLNKLVLEGEHILKTEDIEMITDIIEKSNIKE